MSREVLVKLRELDITKYEFQEKTDKVKILTEKEEKISMHMTMNKLEIKYLPDKYDKLVLVLDKDTIEHLERLENHAGLTVPVEPVVKDGTFSCRVSKEVKEDLLKLKQRDIVDIAVSYNGLIEYGGKWYLSFTLQDFKLVKKAERKSYFA